MNEVREGGEGKGSRLELDANCSRLERTIRRLLDSCSLDDYPRYRAFFGFLRTLEKSVEVVRISLIVAKVDSGKPLESRMPVKAVVLGRPYELPSSFLMDCRKVLGRSSSAFS